MCSDGDILGDIRGSARRRKLRSTMATSGSIPSSTCGSQMQMLSVQARCVITTFLICALSLGLLLLSLPHSVRPLRYTLTG